MSAVKTKEERIKEAEAQKAQPQPNRAVPLCYFEIGRYVEGSFRGAFTVRQLFFEKGKKPTHKPIADGVDMTVALASLERAIRRRVYK